MRRRVHFKIACNFRPKIDSFRCHRLSPDSEFLKSLQVNLSRLIAYAESADVKLQREVRLICMLRLSLISFNLCVAPSLSSSWQKVAEKLANEAVKPNRQVSLIIEFILFLFSSK